MHFYTTNTDAVTITTVTSLKTAVRVAMAQALTQQWESYYGDSVSGQEELEAFILDYPGENTAYETTLRGRGVNLETGEDVKSDLLLEDGRITVLNEDSDPFEVRYGEDFEAEDLEELTRRVTLLAKAGVREVHAWIEMEKTTSAEASVVRGFLELIMERESGGKPWSLDLTVRRT